MSTNTEPTALHGWPSWKVNIEGDHNGAPETLGVGVSKGEMTLSANSGNGAEMLPATVQPSPNPENAIRAPKGSDRARIEFPRPVPSSALGGDEGIEWVWYGYLARGHCTLFTGIWKAGKTTLLAHAIRSMGSGGTLGTELMSVRVLVISEESEVLWRRRHEELGIGDHAEFLCKPLMGRPDVRVWRLFTAYIAALVTERKFDVVIFDTIAGFLPVKDENAASEMLTALSFLNQITATGAAILITHHPRKGDATEGQASRGSGALPGFVDTIIEMRRFDASRKADRRRVLTSYSRFSETPDELVVELTDTGYSTVGTKADTNAHDRNALIAEVIGDGPGLTSDEIRNGWPVGDVVKPSKRQIDIDLNDGVSKGWWSRSGKGKKGDPYRFSLAENSIRAGSLSIVRETNSESDDGLQPDDMPVEDVVASDISDFAAANAVFPAREDCDI